jgi:acyl-CoA synthetase (AMP-forming)/AMP-acid ligase II
VIVRSPFPDVSIPDLTVPAFVLARARERGDRPALIEGNTGQTITYTQLADGADRVAAGLFERGFRPGDVLAIFSPNMPEFAFAFYGTLSAGCIVTTVSPLATEKDLLSQLGDSAARTIFTIPALMDRASAAAAALDLKEIFVFGEAPGANPLSALLNSTGPVPQLPADPNAIAVLPYSSGTTGLPKGVQLTHRNLIANVVQFAEMMQIADGERWIAVLPFFHIYGMNVVLNFGLHCGASLVTTPRFDFEPFLRMMQTHRIARAYLAPPCIVLLAKNPIVDQYDLSALRIIFSGAAPLDHDLQAACTARLHCTVLQGYGLTESSPVTHASREVPLRFKPGSVGLLVANTECVIVDPISGAKLPAHQDGEIWVRGPQVMQGYLNNPEATAATLDEDGWLHTGDIGHFDEEGFYFIVDRLKELIKYRGYQVAPAELEALLLTHPSIADAAVVGIPDEHTGENPKAFVVRSGPVSEADIIEYIAARVAPYKKIRAVEFIEAIPKSPSGKILRRLLKDRQPSR